MATRPRAYRVPFVLERDSALHVYRLVNESTETVSGVSFTVHGGGVMALSPPRVIRPGHGIEVTIAARSSDAILVVRWFRADGAEYLWRVPL